MLHFYAFLFSQYLVISLVIFKYLYFCHPYLPKATQPEGPQSPEGPMFPEGPTIPEAPILPVFPTTPGLAGARRAAASTCGGRGSRRQETWAGGRRHGQEAGDRGSGDRRQETRAGRRRRQDTLRRQI